MSRKNRHRQQQATAPAVAPAPPSPNPGGYLIVTDPDGPGPHADEITRALAEEQSVEAPVFRPIVEAGGPAIPETFGDEVMRPATPRTALVVGCGRLITHDSLWWRCACGGSGRVGRSNDGIPYVDENILAHTPGETRS